MYHTYVDWTDDGRPFYVGMGDDARVSRKLGRNKHHTHVSQKHGQDRRIVASFEERNDAVDLEIKLIAEHHTFVDDPAYNGVGTNYTLGGEGCRCSEETRKKISESRKGKPTWNKGRKDLRPRTEAEKQRLREANTGERNAMFGKSPNWGKKHSNETRTRMRKSHICSVCKTIGHTKTTCPERPVDAVNVVSLAQQRRHQR